jgi:hypothetical protein
MPEKFGEWLLNNIIFENRCGDCVLQKIDFSEIALVYSFSQQVYMKANKLSESYSVLYYFNTVNMR